MSERKVLNKYYPPDFDPSKIPRMKLAKNRQYTVRLMAPFNMRCITCGEYIYKGKKFNARKEDVENETYLGIRIYRFYIKCTRCLQEISFKTDPKNTDYEIEAGATRNFMALKLAEEQARKEEEELREEEANNPMKLLENRTQQSRNEIELLESLEELKDLNRRHQSIDYDTMLQQYDTTETERQRLERQEREDEEYIKSIAFKNRNIQGIKRIVAEEIIEDVLDESDDKEPEFKKPYILTSSASNSNNSSRSSNSSSSGGSSSKLSVANKLTATKGTSGMMSLSVGSLSNKNSLKNIVKRKDTPNKNDNKIENNSQTLKNNSDATATETKSTNATDCSGPNGGGGGVGGGGLALLTAYSDSEDSDNSN